MTTRILSVVFGGDREGVRANPQAEPSPLEREIDELVYALSPKGNNNMG